MSRVSVASARLPPCLRFLLASFVLPAVCPPVSWVISVWFVRFPRVLPLVAPRGSRVVRPCGASFACSLPRCRSLGRSGGLPSLRSALSSRPLALLLRHSGLPLRGCFCPASRVWLVFLPPALRPRPRFAAVASSALRGGPARLCGALWLLRAWFLCIYLCGVWLPSVAAPPRLRLWLLLACPLRGSAALRCPVGLLVCMRGFVRMCAHTKTGDYSSPIIKFSMYSDLFLNRCSFIHASRLSRIVTALCRLVEGRPAPSLRPPRLDFLHIG